MPVTREVTGTGRSSPSVGLNRSAKGVQHGRRRRHRGSSAGRAVGADPQAGAGGTPPADLRARATSSASCVVAALAAFLLYYVGPRDIAETTLKVVLAVVLTAALWVGANLLFDQAYAHWTRFNTILGVVAGFLGYFVAEANGLFAQPVRRPGAVRRPRRVRRRHRVENTTVRHQRSALGADRRRRPRSGDVPAQRPPPATGPLPAGGARVHRLRLPHRVRVRRVGVARSSTGRSCGSASASAPSCSG